MWWRDVLLVFIGIIFGFGLAAFLCMCRLNHPDRPLPPLK